MKNVRVRASVDEIARGLQGTWRAEHLFALKQALGAFDFVGTQLAEERYRERVLRALSQRAAKLGMQMVAIAQPA